MRNIAFVDAYRNYRVRGAFLGSYFSTTAFFFPGLVVTPAIMIYQPSVFRNQRLNPALPPLQAYRTAYEKEVWRRRRFAALAGFSLGGVTFLGTIVGVLALTGNLQ